MMPDMPKQYVPDDETDRFRRKRAHGMRLDREDQELIMRLYDEDRNVSRIAQRLGVARNTIYKALKARDGSESSS